MQILDDSVDSRISDHTVPNRLNIRMLYALISNQQAQRQPLRKIIAGPERSLSSYRHLTCDFGVGTCVAHTAAALLSVATSGLSRYVVTKE